VLAVAGRTLQIVRATDLGFQRWSVLGAEAEQRLECRHRCLAAVVTKHELVEVNPELVAAHSRRGGSRLALAIAGGCRWRGLPAGLGPVAASR